jgi:hypothetical protein
MIDTAWELLHDAEKRIESGAQRKRQPGAGGPQYSG